MAEQGLPAFRDADWSASDELIVATEHLGFVRELIGSQITAMSSDPQLGLTRLRISARKASKQLRRLIKMAPEARDIRADLDQQSLFGVDAPGTKVDQVALVAAQLRALAAAQHGGWIPTLGRNRYVVFPGSDSVGVTSETSFGIGAKAADGPQTSETSFGSPGQGRVRISSETSFGGGGMPRPLSGGKRWSPPPPRSGRPGRGVRVGLLDSGIWPHPWLAGGWIARPSDVLPDRVALGPVAGHGTFTAGLILSQAPGATIVARRVLDEEGQGTAWDVAKAIVELGSSGISVLNLSFACYTTDGQPPLVLARAVDRLDPNIIVVAAAGNHAALTGVVGSGRRSSSFAELPAWPAALSDVVAVGALDRFGLPADFSPERPWVDVAARGVDLRSTYLPVAGRAYPARFRGGWAEWSGTSFSAALVSGAIAAGIDPGRFEASEVVADLLSHALVPPASGKTARPSLPRRLNLRTAGWARGSKPSPR